MYRRWLFVVWIATLPCFSSGQDPHVPDGFRGGAEIVAGNFLVASPLMRDPRFHQTVILLIQHDAKGTMGLIVNRPGKSAVHEYLPAFKGLSKEGEMLFYGGPVSGEQLFFLIRDKKNPKGTIHVVEDIHVTSSTKVVSEWLGGKKPENRLRVYLGYAGWVPNQLASEIVEGSWTLFKADSQTVFEKNPAELWQELDDRSHLLQTSFSTEKHDRKSVSYFFDIPAFKGSSLAGPERIIP